jgi:hypothetical protein
VAGPVGESVEVAATVAAEALLDAAAVAPAAVEEPDVAAAHSLSGTAGSAMQLRVGREARWVPAAAAAVVAAARGCTSAVMRTAAAVRCGCMCAGWVSVRRRCSSNWRCRHRRRWRVVLGIGAGSWMSVVMGIGSTFGVAFAVREVAGRRWAFAAGVLHRHCKKPGWGMAVTAAMVAVAGMGQGRRTTAVELIVGRTEDMDAAAVTGSWAAVAHMGPRVLHCWSSNSRCLGTVPVRLRGSEDRHWRWDEACRTSHWPGCTC